MYLFSKLLIVWFFLVKNHSAQKSLFSVTTSVQSYCDYYFTGRRNCITIGVVVCIKRL